MKTWLRAVLAQRHIDAVRVAKRFESLDEPERRGQSARTGRQMVLQSEIRTAQI